MIPPYTHLPPSVPYSIPFYQGPVVRPEHLPHPSPPHGFLSLSSARLRCVLQFPDLGPRLFILFLIIFLASFSYTTSTRDESTHGTVFLITSIHTSRQLAVPTTTTTPHNPLPRPTIDHVHTYTAPGPRRLDAYGHDDREPSTGLVAYAYTCTRSRTSRPVTPRRVLAFAALLAYTYHPAPLTCLHEDFFTMMTT
ncbi:hypothetical protein BD310DRAFT_706722 [Dichomitus squalens]|uniref:Uncharacterized protein n=1 Tax=Dichomitus squalens TaxID=114155 RepID=A0A4Q9PLX2_9APHY|nr:hypothetical protein BD310DRAFT_706722 [Dichomitus squalens]